MEFRVDSVEIKEWSIDEATGYARFLAPIAREGFLIYQDADGSDRREYVSRRVLRDSAHTFADMPVTIGHPEERVCAENAKKYAIGWTGQIAKLDENGILWLSGTVFDAEAIALIKSGESSEISCGYLVKTVGKSDGTYEQVERQGNHVAAVYRGRAGPDVAFKIDGHVCLFTKKQRGEMAQFTINNDSITVDDASVAAKIQWLLDNSRSKDDEILALKTRLDAANGLATGLQAKIKDVEGQLKAATDAAEGDRASTAEKLGEEVKARLDAWAEVLALMGHEDIQIDHALDVRGIHEAYLKAIHPEIKLDGQDAAYIQGVYDGLKSTNPTNHMDPVRRAIHTARTDAKDKKANIDRDRPLPGAPGK